MDWRRSSGWRRRRRAEAGLSRAAVFVLGALTAVGLVIFAKELPSLRRYLRLRSM